MILVIDDDYSIHASLGLLLKQAELRSVAVSTPEEALRAVSDPAVELVLQDMNFGTRTTGNEGLELLRQLRETRPDVPVILITAWGTIELAVEGMRAGASDFITKPWSNEQVLQSVRTALGLRAQRRTGNDTPDRKQLEALYDLDGVVGRDPAFLKVIDVLGQVAPTDASVLITGDTGTGKEVLAEFVHRNSPRRAKPLVKVNLGGVPAQLFESEMFGHVRGAFTDAREDRQGRFAAADGGTIFLDEIGDLQASCQVKLLRVLQDRSFEVLGDSRTRSLDVRVLSATNADLQEGIRSGRFREDLLYRINLIQVRVPSLAERVGDIPLLARHFLHEAAASYDRSAVELDREAEAWLRARPWPGNLRQLRHRMARALLLATSSTLGVADLERTLGMDPEGVPDELPGVGSMTMEEIERAMIEKAMRHHDGNVSRVAESLGLSRAALYRRLEKHGIRS